MLSQMDIEYSKPQLVEFESKVEKESGNDELMNMENNLSIEEDDIDYN